MLKRILSLILSIVLMVSAVPPQAFAAEMEEAIPAETGPETIVTGTTVPEETVPAQTTVPETEAAETNAPTESVQETTVPTETAEESVPETVPEATVEESVPETTVEETIPEETVEETVAEEATAASSGTCGDNVSWSLSSSGVLTISGSGPMADYSSSSSVPWYASRNSITSVVIRGGVTTIGKNAFYNCRYMTKVTIPSGITSIGDYAFYRCDALTSVTIPSGVASIGNYAFDSCYTLASLTLGSGLKSIGKYAFRYCYELTNVTFPDGLTSIDNFAFICCTGLTGVTIPASVTSIGTGAFSDCEVLTEIWVNPANTAYCSDAAGVLYNKDKTTLLQAPTTLSGHYAIADTVTRIEDYAFYVCGELTGVTIPDGVTYIGAYAFDMCFKLESAVLPDSITELGAYAFYRCESLKDVNIPAGVTKIGTNAFYDCSSITEVTIPAGLTSIGDGAFDGCDALTAIWVEEDNKTYASDARGVLHNKAMTAVIKAPGGLAGGYTIADTVTEIKSGAFRNCTSLMAVYIPSNVTKIPASYSGSSPFSDGSAGLVIYCEESSRPSGWGSYWLTGAAKFGVSREEGKFWTVDAFEETVVIPEYISSLTRGAFYDHTNLKSITIPESITTIPEGTFSGCTALKEVNLPSRLTTIGAKAFLGCTSLKSFYIPSSVTTITAASYAEGPFYNCSSDFRLYCAAESKPSGWGAYWNGGTGGYKVSWGISAEEAGFWAGDAQRSEVVIPEYITKIPDYAFYNRTDLTSVTVPDTVTSIGQYAFYGCTGLTDAPIGDGVTSIADYAFYGCTGLTELIIPESVTTISGYAFYKCTGLKTAYIPASVTTISSQPFYSCNSGLALYCEVSSRPEGWAEKWNNESTSTYSNLTTNYGASRATYDFFNGDAVNASDLVIPEGVTCIPDYAFKNRTDLTSVTVPGTVKTIGMYAFWGCTALERVTLGSGVTKLGTQVFRECSAMETLFIPDTVTTMGDSLFYYASPDMVIYCEAASKPEGWPSNWSMCTTSSRNYSLAVRWGFSAAFSDFLMSDAGQSANVVIPEGFTTIPDYAFQNRTDITSVVIPEGVTSIGVYAFDGCSGLTSVIIPEGVTSIGEYAFQNCDALKQVYIPASVTTIAGSYTYKNGYYYCNSPFYDCNSSLVLYCAADSKPKGWGNYWNCYYMLNPSVTTSGNVTTYYYNTLENLWGTSEEEKQFWFVDALKPEVVIPDHFTRIPDYAFYKRTDLTSIVIPEGITELGSYVLFGCTGLTAVNIPSTVTKIGYYTFMHCTGLTEIKIPDGVTSIGSQAFTGCDGLTSLTFPASVSRVDNFAVSGCDNLTEIWFLGDAPSFTMYSFGEYTGTIYYPAGNETWTEQVRKNSGGKPTWVATCIGEHAVVVDAAVAPTCLETGLTEGSHCSACGITLVARETVNALGHDLGDLFAVTEATCTEEGLGRRDCSRCDHYETSVLEALGHAEVTDAAAEPTCTETGLTEGKHCSRCKEILIAQTEIAALGHVEVIDAAVAATCVSTGKTEGKHCSRCGEVLIQQQVVSMTEHPFGNWTTTVAATCIAAGSEYRECTYCDHSETRTIDSLGHAEVIDAAVAPTCLATGKTEGKHCSRCSEILIAQTVVDALGHNAVIDRAVAPTCTATGKTEGSHCGRCNTVLTAQQTIPALGHIAVIDEAVAPTCTAAGLTEGKHCSRCGSTLVAQKTVSALGHVEVIDAAVEPTCLTTGKTEGKHCSRCSEVLIAQTIVAALGHDEIIDAAVEPTCTETGLTEGKHCGRCEEVLIAQEEIQALGHTEVIDEAVAPTCLETGLTEGKHCSVCEEILIVREIVAVLGHDEVIDEAVAPTCTEPGLTQGKHCARCEEILIAREEIPAAGHDYDVGLCINCDAELPSQYQLFAGKSQTLKITNPSTGKAYTAKQLVWSLDERFEPFATLTAAGKLTAKKVVERARIEIVGTVVATGETISYFVDIYPTVTQLEVMKGEEIVNGKTVLMDFDEESLTLKLDIYPVDTQAKVTWTVSDKKLQYADYEINGDTLTITNPKGKAGTVTIKATADTGVKKNVTVKVQFGSYARKITMFAPAVTTLRGGETLQLEAYVSEPLAVTKPGVVWSVSDKNAASISNGKLTAKNVAHPTTVTVTATSKDGQASTSVDIEIIPKNEGQLVLMNGNAFVTNTTKAMNFGDTWQLNAAVITNGEPIPESVNWTTSKAAVAAVADGRITATGVGTAKVTAEYNGQKAIINIKVSTLAKAMEITTKDGKNLIDENGETMVLLSSGKGVNLVANILTAGAAKTVTWEITEGAGYAKITTAGKITANKDLTSVQYVTVKATAKDGSGTSAFIQVKIVPLATGVQIYENGSRVRSNTTYICDMLTTPTLKLNAKVYPAKANQAVELTSSNKKVADFVDGELVCIKPGTVTITAKALDGSNAKTTFKLTIVKRVTGLSLKDNLTLDKNGNPFVAGGKSLKLAPMVEISPSDATNKKLTWSVSPNDYGIKISTSGVLSTKKVAQPVTVNIMVTTQDGSGQMLSFDVTVYPV